MFSTGGSSSLSRAYMPPPLAMIKHKNSMLAIFFIREILPPPHHVD
ncbi:hypothetical protein JCM15415_20500 [Methanobacterium movens]